MSAICPINSKSSAIAPAANPRSRRAIGIGVVSITASQVASGQGLFTGLALYNPGDIATDVVLSVFAPSGSRRGAALITLGGRQRISRTLVELIPGVRGQVDGYLLLESELPIVAQQLFANRDLTFLSAVPPTILE